MSSSGKEHFGYWTKNHDPKSAMLAARMGGLPAFLLGLQMMVSAIFIWGTDIDERFWASALILGGLVFIFFSLRIRKGRLGSLPVFSYLNLGICAAGFLYGLSSLFNDTSTIEGHILILSSFIIPFISCVVSVNALRGYIVLPLSVRSRII